METTMTESEKAGSNAPVNKGVAAVHPELQVKPKKRKSLLGLAVGATIAVGCAIGGFAWWQHAMSYEETDDATIVGRVHQLSSRVDGTVIKLLAKDNEHVTQGQLLVQIDPKDYQLNVDTMKAATAEAELKTQELQSNIVANERAASAREFEAESAVASARAGVDKADSALSETKLGVALAKTAIKQREAELTRVVSDFERYKSLVQDRAATMQSFEKAKQDKEVAEANLQAAHEAYKQALTRVQQATQALADARAEVTRAQGAAQNAASAAAQTEMSKKSLVMQGATVDKAKSQLANAMTQLSYTNVTAPVTGRIGHRTVEVGQQIERGQALMSIVSDDKWVVANFKETQLNRMRPGQDVDLKVDAFPNVHFKGKVDSISPASGAQFALLPPDNATGNFTKVVQRVSIKIVFDKNSTKGYDDLLAPGMSVIPEVHVGQK